MSKIAKIFILAVLLIVFPFAAIAQLTDSEIQVLVNEFIEILKTDPIKYGPDIPKLYQVKNEFKETLTSSSLVYQGMNTSVISNRSKLLNTSNCLADMSINFFVNVTNAKAREEKEGRLKADPTMLTDGNPSMNSRTKPGQGFGNDGWVWREAMGVSGNDSNLAMMVISVWLHDDRHLYIELDSNQKISKDVLEKLRELKNSFKIKYGDPINYLFQIDTSPFQLHGTLLPKELLVPGSLDGGADIATTLKMKIVSVQAPKMGAGVLPAKYYHVYGGASFACMLRQRGITTETTIMAAKKVAEIYRAKRTCEDVKSMADTNSIFRKSFDAAKKLHAELKYDDFLDSEARRLAAQCPLDSNTSPPECALVRSYFGTLTPLYRKGTTLTDEERKTKVARMMDRMNASTMLLNYSRSSGRLGDYCEESPKVYGDLKLASAKWCENLDKEDCERGIRVIQTWETDFAWTIAQQETGAQFGANKCTPLGSDTLHERCVKATASLGNSAKSPGVR